VKAHSANVAELANMIESVSGNVVPAGHYPFLEETANKRAQANGLRDLSAYVRALASGGLAEEWAALLNLVTIKESFFFRGPQQFEGLRTTIIPSLIDHRRDTRRLRVWSAGCAHGEEPGTIAIALAEHPLLVTWEWSIDATDVDVEALELARIGVYDERAVAGVPTELRKRYFTPRVGGSQLSPLLRQRIHYQQVNLVHEPFPVPKQPYDLIFLRNVLIYFRESSQRRVLAGLASSLAEDGYFFLGPAETLWRLTDAFDPVDLGTCFCYRRRQVSDTADELNQRANRQAILQKARASPRRIAPPSSPMPATAARPNAPKPTPPRPKPVAVPNPPPAAAPLDTHQRLAHAARLLAESRVGEAAEAIGEAVRVDPSDPAGRALEGFLHDLAGRAEEAIVSYRACLFLDQGLYQVRLLLADALRRLGWQARADHEYRQVLTDLDRHSGRELSVFAELPVAGREQARRRARHSMSKH
jgi:chemotaxis protein methyltransferase CheR